MGVALDEPTAHGRKRISHEDGDAAPEMPAGGWLPEHRAALLPHHPLTKRRYTIPTTVIQHAYRASRERVYARHTGLIFIGKTRYGKTTCAKAIRQYLLEEFPHIHVIVVAARSTLRPVAGHAYRVILESVKHVCAARADATLLLRNVVADVETALAAKGGDHFVMILDEVNLFGDEDIVSLLELGNLLELRGITMTVISFGQPGVAQRITSLQQQNKQQLIARFFRRPKSFVGCTGVDMLRDVLTYLDTGSEWPEGSGWSYTEFFFPQAYQRGFRFHRCAELIWQEMSAAMPDAEDGLNMEAITMTIDWLFLSLHRFDNEQFVLEAKDIQNAIDVSDLSWGS
ncbi:conserved hypothetical protein [Paraburkholderia piptadeniae]|uniref:ORC1/DEAH AAA+ ATPase domain-containing protein n=1 Tax=Paraburkholderia piptadeniae TaxID=1701573 RepID=A0A1N7SQ02_9BURK|nr:AAA family ATPase [Paraburkholderia piptadeniae]SIT49458.1 conserved hypothetical protein [Paraburkholderia piptadeniae]